MSQRLARKLRECLAWVDEHGGSLVFEGRGVVNLFGEEGETCASADGFNIDTGAETLAELLKEAEDPATLPPVPIVQQITWFGLGETAFAWEERKTVSFTPDREFRPQSFRLPGGRDYLIHQIKCGGVPLLATNDGIPSDFFCEVTLAPQILFPVIGPGKELELELRAPACPKAPQPFSGALYGFPTEQRK